MKDEDKKKVEPIKDLKTLRKKREKSAVNNIAERKQAEEKLQDSEEYLKILFDYAPDAYYISDIKGKFIDGNKAAERLIGYKREELIGKSFLKIKLLSLVDIPKAAKVFVKNIMGQPTGPDEFTLNRKDNSKVTVEISAYPVKIKGRALVLGIARDITERKQAEEVLKESEGKLRNIFENSTNLFYSHTPEHVLTYLSPQVEDILGYTQEEAMIKWTKLTSDNPVNETGFKYTVKAIETGKRQPPYELELVKKNGEKIWVEVREFPEIKDGKTITIIGSLMDITARKQAEERIKHLNLVLRAIRNINQLIFKEKDRERLLKGACNSLIKTRGYYHSQIVLLDKEGKFDSYAEADLKKDFLTMCTLLKKGRRTAFGQMALKQKDVVIIEDPASTCPDCPLVQACSDQGSVMAVRLEHNRKIYGVMSVSIPAHFVTDKEEQALFKEVAGDIVLGLHSIEMEKKLDKQTHDLQQSYQRTKRAMDATIETMSKIIEAKDPYTAGHQQRVSQLATAIAKELNLSQDKVEGIRITSLIHDIGKIGIPTEILSKPTRLSDIEFSLIKEHSQIGHDILKSIDFSYPVASIVLQHHERLDGSGYPNNLKGEKILLEARILGIADVVEAMSSHRPYRPALGIDKALEEISQNKGILYDSKVVDTCLRLFKEKGFKFE